MLSTRKITLYGDRFVNYSNLFIPHSKHIKISLCFINIYNYLSTKIENLIKNFKGTKKKALKKKSSQGNNMN